MPILFNEICINEEMLPKYIYTHTHTHTHTHFCLFIFSLKRKQPVTYFLRENYLL